MSDRSVTHSTFTIERTFAAPPERVFTAFSDPAEKARWFKGPDDWSNEYDMDFRIGGREFSKGGPAEGPISTYEARFQDIVPNERLVLLYEMYQDDTKISVSLSTAEFKAEGTGTRMVLTDQGAYLDGWDKPEMREHGTGELLDTLVAYVDRQPVNA